MMRLAFVLLASAAVMAGCSPSAPNPQAVVDLAIAAQGGPSLDRADVRFDLRGRNYRVFRDDGLFRYERTYTDPAGAQIHDVLSNDGLVREVDGKIVQIDSATAASAETGVNSVIYFALLPYPLNDPAVRKRDLGSAEIAGEAYRKVEVTFVPEGGGRDYDDRFVYWFHAERHTMDYLAYYYHTGETGSRFRVVTNPRKIGGILFSDHLNFKAPGIGRDAIQQYDSLYSAGAVEKVSEIRLENIISARMDAF